MAQHPNNAPSRPAPSLILTRVELQTTASQLRILAGLFSAQIRVVQLLAAEGLPELTALGASQFLLKHRTALHAHLADHRGEMIDRLKALILQLATDPVDELRLRMQGTPKVREGGLELPINGVGTVKSKDNLAKLHEQAMGCTILSEFDLIYDGARAAVELRMWGTRAAKGGPRGANAGARVKVDAKRTGGANEANATKNGKRSPGTLTRKQRMVAEKANTAWKVNRPPSPTGLTVTRRSGTVVASPSAITPKMLPAQDFKGPAAGQSTVTTDCSCGGENATCFRCDGRGYYEKSAAAAPAPGALRPTPPVDSKSIVRYEKDARGGSYAVRESGRFLSNADHDQFDDESGPN